MNSDEAQERLMRLTKRQREVLELFCRGMRYEDIGKKLFVSKSTITSHMGNIYEKLGLDDLALPERRILLIQHFCPALKDAPVIEDPDDSDEEDSEPEPVSADLIRIVEEDERALWGQFPPPIRIPPSPPEPEPRPRPGIPCLVVGLLIILAFTAGGALVFLLPGILPSGFADQQLTALAETVQVLAESDSATPGESEGEGNNEVIGTVAPSPNAEAIANTPTPSPTNTPAPTDTPGPPTETPTPSSTPTPTSTSTPLPAPEFFDNFDTGPSPDWDPILGTWLTVNGEYTVTETNDGIGTTFVGSQQWTDYVVTVDIDLKSTLKRNTAYVIVRAQDADNFLVLELRDEQHSIYGNWSGAWHFVVDGEWDPVPLASFNDYSPFSPFTLRVEVEGTSIVTYIDNQRVNDFTTQSHQRGRVGLRVWNGNASRVVSFDDFSVQPLP